VIPLFFAHLAPFPEPLENSKKTSETCGLAERGKWLTDEDIRLFGFEQVRYRLQRTAMDAQIRIVPNSGMFEYNIDRM
jgi:hypothetical protein